jgi:nucleoside-diphosphate-sugar epimerase
MNILITGIHGFVGGNLVASLQNQHIIFGLDIVSLQKTGKSQTFGWDNLVQILDVLDC